jgi:hypothetical protein
MEGSGVMLLDHEALLGGASFAGRAFRDGFWRRRRVPPLAIFGERR